MARLLILITFLASWIITLGQKPDSLLYHAYYTNSKVELRLFFENWAADTPPLSKEAYMKLSGVEKDVYDIFELIYTPLKANREAAYAWSDSVYKGVGYFLLQDKVAYFVHDTTASFFKADIDYNRFMDLIMERQMTSDTVRNFKPRIPYSDVKALFLSPDYKTLMNKFLQYTSRHVNKWDTTTYHLTSNPVHESYKRGKFLQNHVKLWWVAFNRYWRIYSYPYIYQIVFDIGHQNALVRYVFNHESGYAYFQKAGEQWMLITIKQMKMEPL